MVASKSSGAVGARLKDPMPDQANPLVLSFPSHHGDGGRVALDTRVDGDPHRHRSIGHHLAPGRASVPPGHVDEGLFGGDESAFDHAQDIDSGAATARICSSHSGVCHGACGSCVQNISSRCRHADRPDLRLGETALVQILEQRAFAREAGVSDGQAAGDLAGRHRHHLIPQAPAALRGVRPGFVEHGDGRVGAGGTGVVAGDRLMVAPVAGNSMRFCRMLASRASSGLASTIRLMAANTRPWACSSRWRCSSPRHRGRRRPAPW